MEVLFLKLIKLIENTIPNKYKQPRYVSNSVQTSGENNSCSGIAKSVNTNKTIFTNTKN